MNRKQKISIYLGTFLIAFATLALEVTLTRLLSVTTWYHLAFFAVSTAMLGMTAGAVTVYLKKSWFTKDKLNKSVAMACLGYSVIIPVSLFILCHVPISSEISLSSLSSLLILTIASSFPFYFSGIAITAILTKSDLPIGKLYASDLSGASLGCLFVLGGLEVFDAPSLILLTGFIAVLAVFVFSMPMVLFSLRRITWLVLVSLVLLILITSLTPYGIRPAYVKGISDPLENHFFEDWNSFSRVVVYQPTIEPPQYWGASPLAPQKSVWQYRTNIDGSAATWIGKFSSTSDIEHLAFDVTNIAYYLRPNGGACIIGVGGGRDVQSAILFGHEKILGIELNPIFINLLQNQFRDFAGIADYPGVTLIVDEARSYLSRTDEQYTIIEMSLVDTWAATGAGAFSLSENSIYTVEAWQVFFNRLSNDGIFTVSRWFNPDNVAEIGRLVSLATATLLEAGISEPELHIGVIASDQLATLLLSKQPFSNQDINKLENTASELEYTPIIIPGAPPDSERLRSIVSSNSIDELNNIASMQTLNYNPPTDESPYFFNLIRLNHLDEVSISEPGVLSGNHIATLILLGLISSLFIVSLVTIVIPLIIKRRTTQITTKKNILWSGAIYFSLIGAGFMFAEISLIQKLSIFLSHPIYALGILLFSIIASAGIGSYYSERLPLTRPPYVYLYPVVASIGIILISFITPLIVSNMITSPILDKIVVSVLLISPLGLLLGVCFPVGMRVVRYSRIGETPWYWALNGVFGVLCSAITVFISVYFGISTSLYIAAFCYLLLPIFLKNMLRAGNPSS